MRTLLSLLLVTLVAACAQPARMSQMATQAVEPATVAANPGLQGTIELGGVGGGEETSPLWTSEVGTSEFRQALQQSLRASDLAAASPESATYMLEADLIEVDQPTFGFSMTVRSTVDYKVYDKTDDSLFFQRVVTASHRASVSDAFLGVKRLQLANEGSMKQNIRQFLRAFINHWQENKPVDAAPEGVSLSLLSQ